MIHLHNGDVVAAAARRADLPGEHRAFRESLVTGPVVPGDDWIETRARAIADAHRHDLLRVRTDLLEQEQALDEAAARDQEIVLWFEHDLFCLIHLVYLLQRLGDTHISLVWSPLPLAESDPRDLVFHYESRETVEPAMLRTAREVWRAYTSPDPTSLNRFLAKDDPDFPFLREGLALHCARFPSAANGLGAVEQRALTHVASGFHDFATLFEHLNEEMPRLGFGDTEVFRHLQMLAGREVPLLTITGEPPKAMCTITPQGEQVLRGEADDIALNDPDQWLGGAHLTGETTWRWTGTNLSAAS
ncbi:MAG: hypothetical protein M3Q69_12700 [Acidobacteriota bacterium]|nr:hypothetical protein [Acidobacteriota bacterium]